MSGYMLVEELFGMLMLASIVLIPIAGFTARFAIKPLVEVLVQRQSAGADVVGNARVRMLEERIAHLETSLQAVEQRHSFDELLGAGPGERPPLSK